MRVVLVVVTVFTAPVPVIQTLNAQLTARVHDVGPLYDGSFTDPKPAIGINSSSSFHDGINLPDINISGANPTGGSPSLGLFVPGNGLLEYAYQAGQQFASWDGSTGKMITNVADTGSAVWTNAGADIAPYTMIRFTVTRDLVTGTASYDPIIAGTDPANVKKYDVINATFSGKPSFGPFAILSLPRIIDDETFEFDTSFSQAIDLSSFNILNFDVLDPNGKAMIPLTVKPQTVGGRTSATYRFASDAPLANGTYQVNARANQLLSFQHSTPPQFWEYVQDRNVGPLNIKFTCPPITTVPELKQGGSAIWAMDIYDKKEPPNNYIKNYGCTITCAAMVLDYFAQNSGTLSPTPRTLNTFLTAAPDGYNGAHEANWYAILNYAVQNGIPVSFAAPPQDVRDDNLLHDHLCANEPVILKVMHPRVDKKTGKTISTTLIDPFTQPAINERVLVEVDDTSSMRDGSKPKTTKSFLHIAGGGFYQVEKIKAPSTAEVDGLVEIRNLGYVGNALPGASVAASAVDIVKQHYVVATGQTSDGTININDPGFPHTTIDSFYYNTYVGTRVFKNTSAMHSAVQADLSELVISAHCPVDLVLTDPAGSQTGFNPSSGQTFNQIPKSSYIIEAGSDAEDTTEDSDLPDSKEIHIGIPVDGSYKLQVIGTDTGPFNLDFVGYDAGGNPSLMSIAGNAAAGSEIDYTVAYSSVKGLRLK